MAQPPATMRSRGRPLEIAGLFALGIGALYLGQGIFVPLVLAVLVAFALNPIVDQMRRIGISQFVAVVITMTLVTVAALLLSYVMAGQLLKLAVDLPQYQQTVAVKLRALQGGSEDSPIGRLAVAVEELGKQVAPTVAPNAGVAPIPVTLADRPASPLTGLTGIFGSILGPLATGALVVIFSVFLLLERVELRDRFLKLVSLGDLRTSTKVMNESAGRVSRYLLVQLGVNCGFGIVFGAGMFLLGVPNAALWGLLTIIFRYIPFIGTLAAVVFPAALAFAVDPGWTMLIGVVGIYAVLELLTTNAIEPNLYGSSTGLSAMAVLVAAIFWATLWGLVGLVLATPLTVCLVVLGRYVPQLAFLDVLLGSEPVLLPEERFYQRLLAGNVAEAIELSEAELTEAGAAEFYDRVAIPALRLAEIDLQRDSSDLGRRRNVVDAIDDVIEELDVEPEPVERVNEPDSVLVVGGRSELDGAAAAMLAHSLSAAGLGAHRLPPISLTKDGITQLDLSSAKVVCICYLDRHPQPYVRLATARLRRKNGVVTVIGCLFGGDTEPGPVDASVVRTDVAAQSIAEAIKETRKALELHVTAKTDSTAKSVDDRRIETFRRFATENDWLASASQEIADTFKVPLALAQLVPVDPAAPPAAHGSLADRVIAAGEPVMISDTDPEDDVADDAFLVENGFRSFLGVPLKLRTGETVGTITLYDSVARDFGPDLGNLIHEAALLVAKLEARVGA